MQKKVFGVKVRKNEVADGYFVPMHPELSYIKSLNDSMWEAKDMNSGVVFRVVKAEKGNFVEYEIEEIV